VITRREQKVAFEQSAGGFENLQGFVIREHGNRFRPAPPGFLLALFFGRSLTLLPGVW
jgi:hypothetical protein